MRLAKTARSKQRPSPDCAAGIRVICQPCSKTTTHHQQIAAPHYLIKVEIHYAARKDGEIKTETFARQRCRHPCHLPYPCSKTTTHHQQIAAPHYFIKVEIHYAARKDGEIKTETFARQRSRRPCHLLYPCSKTITHHQQIAAPHCFEKVAVHYAARKDGEIKTETFARRRCRHPCHLPYPCSKTTTHQQQIAAPHYFIKVEIHYAARIDGEIKTETFARQRCRHPCHLPYPCSKTTTHHQQIAPPHCFIKVEVRYSARKDGETDAEEVTHKGTKEDTKTLMWVTGKVVQPTNSGLEKSQRPISFAF